MPDLACCLALHSQAVAVSRPGAQAASTLGTPNMLENLLSWLDYELFEQ
jgi:hypothetical protein